MKTLYHLSKSDSISRLSPRIPTKVLLRENPFEDSVVQRISFASSIDGCILGLQLSPEEFVDGKLVMYVYNPVDIDESRLVTNSDIVKERLVFDAEITGECWYLDDVRVELVGSITVYDIVEKTIEYTPIRIGDPDFLKPNGKLETYLMKFKWNF